MPSLLQGARAIPSRAIWRLRRRASARTRCPFLGGLSAWPRSVPREAAVAELAPPRRSAARTWPAASAVGGGAAPRGGRGSGERDAAARRRRRRGACPRPGSGEAGRRGVQATEGRLEGWLASAARLPRRAIAHRTQRLGTGPLRPLRLHRRLALPGGPARLLARGHQLPPPRGLLGGPLPPLRLGELHLAPLSRPGALLLPQPPRRVLRLHRAVAAVRVLGPRSARRACTVRRARGAARRGAARRAGQARPHCRRRGAAPSRRREPVPSLA